MDDEPDRNQKEPPPDGYFNFPEGRGQVVFLDDAGNPMTPEEFDRYVERRRKKDEGKAG